MMNAINLNEFTVNLRERKVTHRSGVVISFDSFETEADWLQDDCAKMRNPDLYNGYPIRFGLNINGKLPGLFRSALFSGDFNRHILEQLQSGKLE